MGILKLGHTRRSWWTSRPTGTNPRIQFSWESGWLWAFRIRDVSLPPVPSRATIPCLSARTLVDMVTEMSESKSVDIHKENAHMYPSGSVNISALRPLSEVFIFFRAVFFVALRFHFLLSAIYSAVKEGEINQLQVSFSSFFQTALCVSSFRWLWIIHFH